MSKKKVLVIGGTGIAGQFITDYLLHYHDICELFIGGFYQFHFLFLA